MGTSLKPDMIVLGAATWSIKLHNGSTEALNQYKTNLTSMAQLLEKLAEHGEVIWVLQDPVLEELLRDDRKMITNQQIDLYNEAALSILSSINSVSKAKVQILRASRLAAEQTISKSLDGLHLPKSTRDIAKFLNREQTDEWKGWMQLVILIYHISGASAFIPVYMHVRVLVAAYLFQTGYGHFSFFWLKGDFGLHRVCQAVFHGMLFAFLYLVLQKCQVLSEGKGEPLFSHRISDFLLFISVVSFLILAFILIRNIPGYARSVYSSFFAWFGKISLEWSIKLHNGSTEALNQYKTNLTSMAQLLEKLAEHGEVIWVLQDPVLEELLRDDRKMITNQQIDLYNEAALSILNSINSVSKAKVQILRASRLAAEQTISKSLDGLHLPKSTRDIKLTACFFILSISGYLLVNFICRNNHRENKLPKDIESGEEKKPSIAISSVAGLKVPFKSVCKLGLIMAYFYFCDRADIFMKEQKFYTHSSFFIPLIFILVLGFFYNENSKEAKFLNREQTDEWKGWMQLVILIYHISGASAFIPVYMHVRVLVAAYLFQTGYGHFSFFWLKGDFGLHRVCQVLFRLNFLVVVLCLVMDRAYQFYYFVPLVTFWFAVIYGTMAMWPQILQKKASGNALWNLGLLLKLFFLLSCILLLNYSQAVFHGMLFAFLYLVLQKCQLFICQYHIWLAADTKGILVLIPGNPVLNIIISTFIFVCVAHEISQITNELAQIAIPKDGSALLKRLLGGAGFLVVLLLSAQESKL
ncbi:hypothetical protein EOD39_7358 [Acipenser ruthenus]|uniref:Cas1p 10 TM acyl transferase domain-containing protein n=1 Tax=Acipenser ruthenus TaxID=7906 RepID=A0A662YWZ8_ACIRT|nr:hypothetical protein EOD39_7358 [Acipenser ruthenus]